MDLGGSISACGFGDLLELYMDYVAVFVTIGYLCMVCGPTISVGFY